MILVDHVIGDPRVLAPPHFPRTACLLLFLGAYGACRLLEIVSRASSSSSSSLDHRIVIVLGLGGLEELALRLDLSDVLDGGR